MESVEPEDEPGSYRSPLPPEDRLWRHPSELGLPAPAAPCRRSVWLWAGASAVGAGLLSTGLVVVAVAFLAARDRGPAERPVAGGTLAAEVSDTGDGARIADQVGPAVVRVRFDRGRTGSGVIFRSDGHLLTSAHVVDGAATVTVVLAGGRELTARVVGSDAETDTAVVKIDGGTFPVATMGSSADLRVGQEAVAVGAPIDSAGAPSANVAVISALHRTVATRTGTSAMHDLVQVEAPVAPRSSGSALVDRAGMVVGITTAMAGRQGGSGYAVPIDLARAVADQLMASGRVVEVWIGIQGQDLDHLAATEMHVEGGAMVAEVKHDSPAWRGGVAARDVVVAVDGRPVVSMGQLRTIVRLARPGTTVSLDVVRDRRRDTMAVTVAERPADAEAPGRS